MRSLVIYHSISGNTKRIAEAIHAGMSQAGDSSDIARLREVSTGDLAGYDLIGPGSIDFSQSPPFFKINCDYCWLCEQTCPNGAIEINWEPYYTAHLPMIPPLEKSLEVFETRGKFRRLVPLEDIGWDTPVWQFKRPRFKIV